jgi:polyhydroxyalkanoate synthesis regulator phasin
MARSGLTKSQVRTCREQLLAEGRYPSVDAVRLGLGNTGSKSTIHRFLKELVDEDMGPDAGIRREDTARSLHDFVDELADRLHGDAQQRIRRLEAAHREALLEKERELAALRATVARLEAQVEALEEERGADGFPHLDDSPSPVTKGFGLFSSRLAVSRSGGRDISPFSMMAGGARSEAFDVDSMRPPALKFL